MEIFNLLILEQVHVEFPIEGKLLDTLPTPIRILVRNSLTFRKYSTFYVDNIASVKTGSVDLYQSQSLQFDHHLFICEIVVAAVLSSLSTLSWITLRVSSQ